MIDVRLVERPAFEVVGRKTWIGGQDNAEFGRFWAQCRADGLLAALAELRGSQPGPQTDGMFLGVSQVERDPSDRAFYFMIAVEAPADSSDADLERHTVPAARWAVFRTQGAIPDALVEAEMYAFGEWLPASGYAHAPAPEMEVYPPEGEGEAGLVEFWLPIQSAG
jgi:AraC family transcriptional regulator